MPQISLNRVSSESKSLFDRLGDYLRNHFGDDAVSEIAEQSSVDEAVALGKNSNVQLIIIDPTWDARTMREANRAAIGTAIAEKLRLIPILLNGAIIPASSELPDDIAGLARRTPLTISEDTFRQDAAKIIEAIEKTIAPPTPAAAPQVEARNNFPPPAYPQAPPPSFSQIPDVSKPRSWRRSSANKAVAGVLGGLGVWLGIDPVIFRIIYAIVALITGIVPLVILYVVLALIIPSDKSDK